MLLLLRVTAIVERSYRLGDNPKPRMQRIRFNYSLKNIGLPTHDQYRRAIINKTEDVIQRMRWRAFFYLNGDTNTQSQTKTQTFGLKSKNSPPTIPDMKPFEEDLTRMIENVQFRQSNDEFMATLETDKQKIKSSRNVFIFAEKTRNVYETDAATYNKLLTENITKTYKLAEDGVIDNINKELKDITQGLKIANLVETMAQSQSFISLKNHKDNFENNPKCRLINPAKSDIGKVSKSLLDRINNDVRNKTAVHQWKNSDDTITWFKSIQNKVRHSCPLTS